MIISSIEEPTMSSVVATISDVKYKITICGEVHKDRVTVKATLPGFMSYVWDCPIKDDEVFCYWDEVLYDKIDELRRLIVNCLQDNKPIFIDTLFKEVGFD